MNRGRGKHLYRICKQNQSWLKVDAEPDSGILGLQAGKDVKTDVYPAIFREGCTPSTGFGGFLQQCEGILIAYGSRNEKSKKDFAEKNAHP
jgi:hypothetical protein